MKEIKKFDNKNYVKLKIQSLTLNGKEIDKTIKSDDIKNNQSIVVNIVVSKDEEESNQ